jgi:hypothetical protein
VKVRLARSPARRRERGRRAAVLVEIRERVAGLRMRRERQDPARDAERTDPELRAPLDRLVGARNLIGASRNWQQSPNRMCAAAAPSPASRPRSPTSVRDARARSPLDLPDVSNCTPLSRMARFTVDSRSLRPQP